jgi:ABC-type branched-subunit amino acid transport system ATPase component
VAGGRKRRDHLAHPAGTRQHVGNSTNARRAPLAETSDAILTIDRVALAFGGLRALDGVTFGVEPRRLTALIGPNGAGKTTLFNVVSGLLKPKQGTIRLKGRDIAGLTPDAIARAGMVRTFQIPRGLPKMSVFEHLMLYGAAQPGETLAGALTGRGRPREEALAEAALAIARRLRLAHVIDNLVGALSGGQKKLLEIGRALMAEPEVILFDEPAAGVNPTLAEEIGDHLKAIVAEGRTVLLIEHDMALVERIAERVVVMALGKTLAEGTFDEVREDRAVQEAYLGGRAAA